MGIFKVQNVSKSFGGLKALQNVNLNVEEGMIHAIIGPNGPVSRRYSTASLGNLSPTPVR